MNCRHFTIGECRSCSLLELPHAEQLAAKETEARSLISAQTWLPTISGPESGFRTKAKLVISGTVAAPTLGILGPDGRGVDLQDCPLYTPGLAASFPALARFVTLARLAPYDLVTRLGELKHLIVTEAPNGELLVRFVLRSTEAESRIRKHLPALLAEVPNAAVVSLNIQPEPKAVLEGAREIVLTEQQTITWTINDIGLHVRPQAFLQTNTEIAAALYATAANWVGAEADVKRVWDLYCGVGGFALHLARKLPGAQVTGVEISEDAIAAATRSATELGLDQATFVAADATDFALQARAERRPHLLVVNPPRRGLGSQLAIWIEDSGVSRVIYSSCNAGSLARDLAELPSYTVARAVVLDMFPHTTHYEVLCELTRAS